MSVINKDTFSQDFLEILKHSLQIILKKFSMGIVSMTYEQMMLYKAAKCIKRVDMKTHVFELSTNNTSFTISRTLAEFPMKFPKKYSHILMIVPYNNNT